MNERERETGLGSLFGWRDCGTVCSRREADDGMGWDGTRIEMDKAESQTNDDKQPQTGQIRILNFAPWQENNRALCIAGLEVLQDTRYFVSFSSGWGWDATRRASRQHVWVGVAEKGIYRETLEGGGEAAPLGG